MYSVTAFSAAAACCAASDAEGTEHRTMRDPRQGLAGVKTRLMGTVQRGCCCKHCADSMPEADQCANPAQVSREVLLCVGL
jgi:hypothetical protein